jgi:hypothetical protein
MLPQALEGLPGLQVDADGRTTVDRKAWEAGSRALAERLGRALEGTGVASFEPSAASCCAWKPFLWEVENRKVAFAKAQIAGPLTSTWATTLTDGTPVREVPELSLQMHRLVLARALAMVAALKTTGTTPLLFLDEPGLFAFDVKRPTHVIELRELGIVASELRQAGALVGVHCCGNTDWASLCRLNLDFISADARLSLAGILAASPAVEEYLARGGWLALGIIPTGSSQREPVMDLAAVALTIMGERRQSILARAVLSPACGLALRSVAESESTYEDLREAQRLIRKA